LTTTTDRPYWLSTLHVRESGLNSNSNLKNASVQQPGWINIYQNTLPVLPAVKYTNQQIEEMSRSQLRQAATTKNQEQTRNRIKSAAKKLGIRPTPVKPAWLRIRDLNMYGYDR
jgi:hypothetical protein